MQPFELHLGDCLESLRKMPDNSVDAIVTDPPYGLTANKKGGSGVASINLDSPYGRARIGTGNGAGGFMGHKWDSDVPSVEIWAECLRVLKPGGHLLAFSGSRTYHRMTCAIEDAGFEVRDQIMWLYGSGFPKSLDVSKAIDKAAGAEREVIQRGERSAARPVVEDQSGGKAYRLAGDASITAPATDAARQWQGWGTALKPAHEPICVARKPLIGTVSENVLEHGTGSLNIDGCRVGSTVETWPSSRGGNTGRSMAGGEMRASETGDAPAGRWPANIIHDGSAEVLAAFLQAPGQMAKASTSGTQRAGQNTYGVMARGSNGQEPRGDAGSAARFFKQCNQDDVCNSHSSAPTAAWTSCLQSVAAAFVQSGAATWASLGGILSNDSTAPSMIVTATESKAIAETVITAMANIGSEFSRVSLQERPTPCGSLARTAATRDQTGITTITTSLSRSDGSAGRATFSITPTSLDHGVKDCEQSTDGKRFIYCAKASRKDRNEGLPSGDAPAVGTGATMREQEDADWPKRNGNHHPTVKPTELMAYLVRLVTPAGGVVLDPFMGSGSTGKAAMREGFRFIGCELSEEYLAIARARIEHELAKRQVEAPKPSTQVDLFEA